MVDCLFWSRGQRERERKIKCNWNLLIRFIVLYFQILKRWNGMVLNYIKVNYWSYLLGYCCGLVLEDNR